MANAVMGLGEGFEVDIVYTQRTGKVTGLRVNNTNAFPCYAAVTLSDGRVFGQTFPTGDTTINLPNNLINITFDADGGPVFDHIDQIDVRIPA